MFSAVILAGERPGGSAFARELGLPASVLVNVAGKTRHMPDEFINEEGNGVTQDFLNYCRPLLGSNLPEPHRLRAPAVKKILNS